MFLPLRYEQVTLREKMPRRFYCRAKWHTNELDSETQVFDLDYIDRDGRLLGGIKGFTVKRAPREALLRGLGGDATRLLYTLGWHEVPIAPASDDAGTPSGTWLVAGFSELAAALPGCIPFDRATDSELLGQVLAQAHEKGMPYAGIVWRSSGPKAEESTAESDHAAGGRDRKSAQRGAHRAGRQFGETARRTVDRHRTSGGDRIR